MRFGAAPGGASNGSVVFLDSTAGQASLTAPTGGNNVIVLVGLLVGADGVTTTPEVVFDVQRVAGRP